jgi:undecaprenyl-diphosphatase
MDIAGGAASDESASGRSLWEAGSVGGRHLLGGDAPRERAGIARPIAAGTVTAVIGFMALSALTIGLGLLVTRALSPGILGDWERAVSRWLVTHRNGTRTDVSLVASCFAETVTVLVVGAIAIGWLAFRQLWRLLAVLVVAIVVEGATYLTVTYVVARHRPAVPRLERLIVSDSYFSGHTAAATVLYGCLLLVVFASSGRRATRIAACVAALLFPTAVALSRMYRGMHFASDAAAGVVVGLGCIVVALIAVRVDGCVAAARRPRRPPRRPPLRTVPVTAERPALMEHVVTEASR